MKKLTGGALLVFVFVYVLSQWLKAQPFEAALTPPLAHEMRRESTASSVPTPKAEPESIERSPANGSVLPPSPLLSSTSVAVERSATPPLTNTKNLLLVGLDRRPGVPRGGRPDTILIAAMAEESGHLGLISVPRDLYVEIPEHGMDRINATFSVAWAAKKDPLELLKRVLQDTLLLPIHHSAAIDLGGFETLVDALGGVEVDVPCAIVDDFVDSRTASGRRILQVEAGRTFMDGATAALYTRSRHGRSDWNRARRQQAVLLGIKRRFVSIDGVARLPEFWTELGNILVTDLRRSDFLSLVLWGSSLEAGRIHGLVLGAREAAPHLTEEGKAVLLPDHQAISSALSSLFSQEPPGTAPEGSPCFAREAALRPPHPPKPQATAAIPVDYLSPQE